jgi:hypothetical protein
MLGFGNPKVNTVLKIHDESLHAYTGPLALLFDIVEGRRKPVAFTTLYRSQTSTVPMHKHKSIHQIIPPKSKLPVLTPENVHYFPF